MSAPALLQLLAALACALAAGMLWTTRARLARDAEEERARTRDAQILALAREAEALRELAPIKIREYLIEAHAQLRRYRQAIEDGHRAARREIERCNGEITRLQERGEWRADDIDRLVQRRERLLETTRAMQPGLGELQHQCEFPERFTLRIARLYPESIQDLTRAWQDLARILPLEAPGDLPALSERVAQSFKYRLDENTLFSSSLFARPEDLSEVWQRPDNGE